MKKIKVIRVAPLKEAEVVEISNDLSALQKEVDGYIEEYFPFEDDDKVCIICNEEGKINGLTHNRAIYNGNGEIIDIIAGPFIICSAPYDSEEFESLSDEQVEKYMAMFKMAETFFRDENDNIFSITYDPNMN